MHTLILVAVVLLIVGVLVWGLDRFPAIDATFKGVVKVVVIVGAAVWTLWTLYQAFGR